MRDHNANSAGVRARRNGCARSARLSFLPRDAAILPARRLAPHPDPLPASGARESIRRAGGSPSRCWCSVNLGLRPSLIPRLAALAALVLERLGRIETVEPGRVVNVNAEISWGLALVLRL